MRRRVIFLPQWRVATKTARGRGGGWLKPPATFLSLLRVNVQESPPCYLTLHFGPFTFNFIFAPHFCYKSFDFVQLGPPIEVIECQRCTSVLRLLISELAAKLLNKFSTQVSISAILSLNFNWQ